MANARPQPVVASKRAVPRGTKARRSVRPLVAIGLVALLGVLMGGQYLNRSGDRPASVPPLAQQDEPFSNAATPPVEDPRSHPAFDEAYSVVCEQTLTGLDRIHVAAGPDLMATVEAEHQALTQRIDGVYGREDLWAATDPLVLEFAENIADDLSSIIDGTDTDFEYLDGDVVLFRSLCQDWFAPI